MEIKFKERLILERKQKGYSQQKLASILNTTQRRISYLESGKIEPDLETLWKLADIFELSVDELLGRID